MKRVAWEQIKNTTLCSFCSQSTQSLSLDIGSDIRIIHHPMVCISNHQKRGNAWRTPALQKKSEIMACIQGLFSDSCRAAVRELIRKQGEGCKLLFTIRSIYYNWTPYMKRCRLWHRAHIFYAALEHRAYLDPNIWYDAPTHRQLQFAQWMALQASLNKDSKSCNQLSCALNMTYRTSFHVAFGSQSDINTDKKRVVWEQIENTTLCSFCSQSTQSLSLDIGSDIRIVHVSSDIILSRHCKILPTFAHLCITCGWGGMFNDG